MKTTFKAITLAALLSLSAATAQAQVTLTEDLTMTTVPQGTTAVAGLTLNFPAGYLIAGGGFSLTFDGAALEFLPDQSRLAGTPLIAMPALMASLNAMLPVGTPALAFGSFVMNVDALGGTADVSATLPIGMEQDVGGDSVAIALAFAGRPGIVLGQAYTVGYTIDAFDANLDSSPFSGSIGITVNAVPEPATYALMLGGLVAVGALARRRTRAA